MDIAAEFMSATINAFEGTGWHADLEDTNQVIRLTFDREQHREAIADLIQKSLVVGFERSGDYWRLRNSTRYWYEHDPVNVAEGSR